MTTIVEADSSVAQVLASATGATDTLSRVELVKNHLEQRPTEYAIVLGPSVPLAAAMALADTMRVTRPSISVILIRDSVDTAVLAEALRAGMREVASTHDLNGIGHAVRRAHALYEALSQHMASIDEPHRGSILTVFSAKGGVGKTTVATNLAVALADHGKRSVCLVDLDLAFGDVAIVLQIFPTRTIADAVPMQHNLDLTGLESLLTTYRDGVTTLVAPTQPDAKDSISSGLVARVLELLREKFDFVVVDTPPAFDDQVLQAFDLSDQILLIATPDIPALKNLKITLETLSLLNYPREKSLLVLNRAQPKVGVTAEEVSQTLGLPIVAMIPSGADVPASVNRGEPIVISDPKGAAGRGITTLANACLTLANQEPPSADDAEPKARVNTNNKRTLFARKGRH